MVTIDMGVVSREKNDQRNFFGEFANLLINPSVFRRKNCAPEVLDNLLPFKFFAFHFLYNVEIAQQSIKNIIHFKQHNE